MIPSLRKKYLTPHPRVISHLRPSKEEYLYVDSTPSEYHSTGDEFGHHNIRTVSVILSHIPLKASVTETNCVR